jgi:predicted transcriptional regulator
VENMTKEILSKIAEGKTLDSISKEIDKRESTVRAMIDSMIHDGYLEQIRYTSGCSMCSMRCSHNSPNSQIKMYMVTDKGMDCISNVQKET